MDLFYPSAYMALGRTAWVLARPAKMRERVMAVVAEQSMYSGSRVYGSSRVAVVAQWQ